MWVVSCGTFYQHFLYSSGVDICICLVSFAYDTYDNFTSRYPIFGLLFVEFWFGRAVRRWLWYRASSAVIPPNAYNSCFGSRVDISHSLVPDWIVLTVDTLPLNLLEKKRIFKWAIDVTNLEHVLHWLTYSYVSLSLHFNTLSSFLCHNAEWLLSTASMPSLSSKLSGSMSTVREGISRNRMIFLIKLCYPEPAVGTLPLAGHRCFNFSVVTYDTAIPFNGSFHHIWSAGRWIRKHLYDWWNIWLDRDALIFLSWHMTQHSYLMSVFTTSDLLVDGPENTCMTNDMRFD